MAWQLRTRKKQRRWPTLLAAGCILFTLFGFFVLPPVVKVQLERRLGLALHRQVLVGHVKVNPFTLAVTVENLEVRERDGRGTFLGWERLYVNFELLSLVSAQWRFREVTLDGPRGRVLVNPDGSLNFSDLLSQSTPAEAAAQPATPTKAVRIGRFALNNARLEFVDRSRVQPFATTLGPVGFTVTDFHTVGGEQAPYRFEAVTELGEKLTWNGWVLADPFRSGGELSVENVVLKKYMPYHADRHAIDVVDGRVSLRGRYEVNFSGANRALRLTGGAVEWRDLKLNERATGRAVVELPAGTVTGIELDGLALQAAVGRVQVKGGKVKLRREQDGGLNLAALVPARASAPAAPVAAGAPAVGLKVAEIDLSELAVEWQDFTAPRPVLLGLTGVEFRVKDVSLADGARMPMEMSFGWQPQGTFKARGDVTLRPLPSAELEWEASDLALPPLGPYLEQQLNARITQGAVGFQGRGRLELPVGAEPVGSFVGEIAVKQFALVDGTRNEELAGFDSLSLSGLQIATAPTLKVELAQVALARPYVRLVLEADKTLNWSRVIPPSKPVGPGVPTVGRPVGGQPDVEIGKLVLGAGEVSVVDRSIAPEVRVAVTALEGSFGELSAVHPGRGSIDLKANVNGLGQLTVAGRIDPLGASPLVDAKVALRGLDLPTFSPYAGKYAGYEVTRGRLAAEVTARVLGRSVDMTNVVTLDQFTFGAATSSPEATKLPVRLGVALLKDTQGKIVIDVPVQGNLDDPEFRVGRVVLRVVVNLLTKAAVSPFSLLGSMFGGGDEALGWQDFRAGESGLMPESRLKLETLVKAMAARPALVVDIEGGYDAAADTFALQRSRLQDQIRRAVRAARPAVDPNIAPADRWEIAPADFAAAVKQAFDRQFPPGTEFGTPLPPPPAIMPPPARKSGNVIRRVVDVLTQREIREQKAYLEEQKKAHDAYVKQAEAVVATGRPLEEMLARLAQTVAITEADLQALADARAQAVRDYFIREGRIAPERLFLAKSVAGNGPRVNLRLQ